MEFKAQSVQGLTLTFSYGATDYPAMAPGDVVLGSLNRSVSMNGTSTPKGQDGYSEEITSSKTFDLTALVRTMRSTLDATGKKLQAIFIHNLSTVNTVTLTDSGTNAYVINSGANITLPPQTSIHLQFVNGLVDVDATHKNIAITATAGQKFRIVMVFGQG